MFLAALLVGQKTELSSQASKNNFDDPSAESVEVTHTYTIDGWYTFISIPGNTSATAENICSQSSTLLSVMRLTDHSDSDAEFYNCDGSGTGDFVLEPHVGYMLSVRNLQPVSITISYAPTNQEIGFTPENDWIGLNNFKPGTKIEDVCAKFEEAGHPIDVIETWDSNQQTRHWCNYPEHDWGVVQVKSHHGYKVAKYTNVQSQLKK